MAMNPEPGKLRRQVTILLLCLVVLAGLFYIQQQSDPDVSPLSSLFPGEVNHKQDLRNKYAKYRAGRLSAFRMLDACIQKLMYAEKGKDALAEYAYALRSQVYLDEGDPEAALAEARKAADIAPSPGRGAVALGDALRALGKDDEAAGAYRQATNNPDYVPEYTVEDPMDARTLDALFATADQIAVERDYEDIIVQGKFTGIDIGKSGIAFFKFEGSQPEREVFCLFKDNRDPLTPTEDYVVAVAQTYGLFFATQFQGQIIMTNGWGYAASSLLTLLDDCVIVDIKY